MKAGYDWNANISYPITKQCIIKAKGENILDMASELLVDPSTMLKAPTTDRRFIITMEYVF